MNFNIKEAYGLKMKLFICPICEKVFVNASALSQHMKFLPCEKVFKCDICQKAFMLKSYMMVHKMRHYMKEQTCCTPVEKSELLQNGAKPSIQNTEDSKKKHECPVCGKTFQYRSSLPHHLMLHTGEKPYICSICERPFTQKSNMFEHWMRRHMKKQIKCNSVEKDGLLQGETDPSISNTEDDEKKYECPVCALSFVYRSSLLDHIMIHTGEKSFTCSICGKSFTLKSTMIAHKMRHIKEETDFMCDASE